MIRLILLGALLCVLPLSAQLPLMSSTTLNNVDGGRSIALLGDVNGDGFGDFVHGPATLSGLPLRVRSGFDASLIYSVPVPPGGTSFGATLLAIGDIDGDGITDFASMNGEGVAAASFSGATGALLLHVPQVPLTPGFGRQAVVVGDADNDGIPDLAISWNTSFLDPGNWGFALYSGVDGANIFTHNAGGYFMKIAAPGDINGDGVADVGFIVGDFTTFAAVLRDFEVRSGVDNSLLYTLSVPTQPDLIVNAATLGDVNADGHDDFVVAFKGTGPTVPPERSRIDAISGQDGSLLWSVNSQSHQHLGLELCRSADVNGDGVLDIITIDQDFTVVPNANHVVALSGLDGSRIGGFRVSQAYVHRMDFDAGEDLNGDGIADLGYVVWDNLGSHVGVFTLTGAQRYGSGLGPAQSLDLAWQPGPASAAHQGQVVVTAAQPNAAGLIVVASAAGNSTLFGLPIVIDVAPAHLQFQAAFSYDASGSLVSSVDLRNPWLAGSTFHLQAFTTSPALACSNGLQLLFSN